MNAPNAGMLCMCACAKHASPRHHLQVQTVQCECERTNTRCPKVQAAYGRPAPCQAGGHGQNSAAVSQWVTQSQHKSDKHHWVPLLIALATQQACICRGPCNQPTPQSVCLTQHLSTNQLPFKTQPPLRTGLCIFPHKHVHCCTVRGNIVCVQVCLCQARQAVHSLAPRKKRARRFSYSQQTPGLVTTATQTARESISGFVYRARPSSSKEPKPAAATTVLADTMPAALLGLTMSPTALVALLTLSMAPLVPVTSSTGGEG